MEFNFTFIVEKVGKIGTYFYMNVVTSLSSGKFKPTLFESSLIRMLDLFFTQNLNHDLEQTSLV